MNIIMTGATSFVGAATVRELLRRGHTVTAIARPASSKLGTILDGNEEALLSGRLLVTENDLSEPEQLLEKVTKPQDVFCHFGWGGSGSASRTDRALQEKNLEISQETIRTAKALGCKKFLFSGSQAEYGMHRDLITEETACEPKSLYGEAKLADVRKGRKALRGARPALHSRADLQRLRTGRPPVDVSRILSGRIFEQQGDVPRRLYAELEFPLYR